MASSALAARPTDNTGLYAFDPTDVVESLEAHGVSKLLVLNGHGGNDFRQMIRELQMRTPLFLCTLNWWTVPGLTHLFEDPGDHAGELETSLMMHLHP
ncbi:MAG: creatininase family protein, partial [Pirellulales bacterium]|nr:creatininase family protein [Pirellulales bacterium]